MLNFALFFVFVLSTAFASMSFLLAQRLRKKYGFEFLTSHFYFIIFLLTFGAYGLWGQIIIRGLISEIVEIQVANRISGIIVFIAMPFLVISWYMLLKMVLEMSGHKVWRWLIPVFASVNLVAIVPFIWIMQSYDDFQSLALAKLYYLIFNTLFFFVASFVLLIPGKQKKLSSKNRMTISIAFIFIALIQALLLYFYQENVYLAVVFIFVLFAGQLFLPAYLSYIADFRSLQDIEPKSDSFGKFCLKYEISPRESEVILLISKGLTNKDIADKLFITLQTVKDHNSRIYLKTMVRNRTELANLVQKWI